MPTSVSASGSLAALNANLEIAVFDGNSIGVALADAAATWNGTLVAEVSYDYRLTWKSARFFDPGARTLSSTVTAPGSFTVPLYGGATHARVRCSVYVAGAMAAVVNAVTTEQGILLTETVTGTSATDFAKASGATFASGDVGVPAWGVRNDAGTAMGSDGKYVPASFDSANSLRVVQAALSRTIDAATIYADGLVIRPTITTSDAVYTAGDVIGGIIQLDAPIASGVPVALRSIVLKDDKNAKPDLQLLFFRTSPAGTYTDNAAVVPTTADMGALVHIQRVAAADWLSIQGVTRAIVSFSLDEGPILGPGTTALFLVIVAVSAPDYAANATDLTAEIAFARLS